MITPVLAAYELATPILTGKKILLGLTGGIACYKIAELVRMLVAYKVEVHIIMTNHATQFITPTTLQALSGNPVQINQWQQDGHAMAHIALSRAADAMLVAPASADFLAKLTHGFADDLLTTTCLARKCPLLVAPAMNCEMWANASTQRNIAQLKMDGIICCGPDSGAQACGEIGPGRMLEPPHIIDAIIGVLTPNLLQNKRVVITAGPTVEALDPVRVISNRSSGKMGFAMARAAVAAGAKVDLISGPVSLPTPYGLNRINVESAQAMYNQVMQIIEHADIFIAVAAVCDWRPKTFMQTKIKKGYKNEFTLNLETTKDILYEVTARENAPFCVGFAAESVDLEKHAQIKRQRKNLPLIIGNVAEKAFGKDHNQVTIFDSKESISFSQADKFVLAQKLIEIIAQREMKK